MKDFAIPSEPCSFLVQINTNLPFFASSKEDVLSYISQHLSKSSKDTLTIKLSPNEEKKGKKGGSKENSISVSNEKRKKKHILSYFLPDNKNYYFNNDKNYHFNNDKNYHFNNDKNYHFNNDKSDSLFIDLSTKSSKLPLTPVQLQEYQQIVFLSEEFKLLFQKDRVFSRELELLVKKHKISKYEFIAHGMRVFNENWKELKEFVIGLNSMMSSIKIYKLKRNQEELAGIIEFFKSSQNLQNVRFLYKIYLENSNRKVDIYVFYNEQNKEQALNFCKTLEKYYFKKEIMISHLKAKPFNLKNSHEFKAICEEGKLMNSMIEKLIKNKELIIDDVLNYKFIDMEGKIKEKSPVFSNSMLFYWKKELRRTEIKAKINEIKAKLSQFAFFSIYFKNTVQLDTLIQLKENYNKNMNEIIIGNPKEIKENSLISMNLIGKWEFIKDLLRQKLIPALKRRNNRKIEIKGFSFNKSKFGDANDEGYQLEVGQLLSICEINEVINNDCQIETENYIVYKTI